MDRDKLLDDCLSEEFIFKVQRIWVERALDYGILLHPERLKVTVWDMINMDAIGIRLLLDIATQKGDTWAIPADWWQHFKQRWFPRWLERRFPVRTKLIGALHKFPEIDLPPMGREFVHLRVIDPWKLQDKLEKREGK